MELTPFDPFLRHPQFGRPELKRMHRFTSEFGSDFQQKFRPGKTRRRNWIYESAEATGRRNKRTGGYLQNSAAAEESASLGAIALIRSMRQHRRRALSLRADFQLATQRVGTLLASQNLVHWPLSLLFPNGQRSWQSAHR
jgi:hypothetical protein